MRQQIEFVRQRDGHEAAIDYAKRALKAYRSAARHRNAEKAGLRHFVHAQPYRPYVVLGIVEILKFLREEQE